MYESLKYVKVSVVCNYHQHTKFILFQASLVASFPVDDNQLQIYKWHPLIYRLPFGHHSTSNDDE